MSPRLRWIWLAACLVLSALAMLWLRATLPAAVAALDVHGIALQWPDGWWLLGVALLPLWVLPWNLTDLPKPQQALQTLVRMLLLALIAAAALGPRRLTQLPRGVQVVHVVDRSESVPPALLDAAAVGVNASQAAQLERERLRPVQPGQRPTQPVQVVAVDAAAVLLPHDASNTTIARRDGEARDTDLAAGLNLALGLLDGHTVPNIVLWTDGLETRGDALALADALREAGVAVHAPALPPLPPVAEFLIEGLIVPPKVKAGLPFALGAALQATQPMQVRCQVQAPGADPKPIDAKLQPGRTRLDLGQLRLKEPGVAELELRCAVTEGSDRFASNNQVRGRVVVEARPKVLYVEGARGQAIHLAQALQDDFEVEVRAEDGLPRSLSGLKQYEAVILSDVPRVSSVGVPLVTDGDMRNLEQYVRNGGGLLVLGGENSLGSGGYQSTYLEQKVLPVELHVDSEIDKPTLAMLLVLDRSGSMSGPKLDLAKSAAKATADALQDQDRFGLVAFDNSPYLLVRLQRAGNRYRIREAIDNLSPAGGTAIYPALDMAYQQLLGAQAKIKHTILLTDGQAPRGGIDALVRQMRKSQITVSTVGVGSDVDRNLLERMAELGGGRSYFTDRPETLPRIFVTETRMVSGQSVVEARVTARRAPGLGRIDLLRGVGVESLPALTGFQPARTKPAAEEILRLSNGKPLLVRWKLGGGKVAVWTSDLKARWAAGWIGRSDYARLSRQLLRDVLQQELGMEVEVRLLRERDQLRVAVDATDDDGSWLTRQLAEAQLTGPNGQKSRWPLQEVAPGRYEATVPFAKAAPGGEPFGAFDVLATLRPAANQPVLASGRATALHPYPDEHRIADGTASLVRDLAERTGGSVGGDATAWQSDRALSHDDWQALWPELVRLALLLLLLDVLLRRVRLGKAPVTRWHQLRRLR